jgi:hypothetical protein
MSVATGCSTLPQFNLAASLSPKNIMDRLQCEIYQAAQEHVLLRDGHWGAFATLTFTVDGAAGLSPSLSYVNALAGATSFVLSGGAVLNRTKKRVFNESVQIDDISQLVPDVCVEDKSENGDLAGNLGVNEIVDLALRSFAAGGPVAFRPKPDSFSELVQFQLIRNINAVGPIWTLSTFRGPGGLIGASRTDTHALTISFAPPTPSPTPPPTPPKTPPTKTPPTPKPSPAHITGSAGANARDANVRLQLQLLKPAL